MTRTLFDVFTRAGAEWVMYALAALSVASVAVILERALFFWRHARSRADVLAALLASGRLEEARGEVEGREGLEPEVVRAASGSSARWARTRRSSGSSARWSASSRPSPISGWAPRRERETRR